MLGRYPVFVHLLYAACAALGLARRCRKKGLRKEPFSIKASRRQLLGSGHPVVLVAAPLRMRPGDDLDIAIERGQEAHQPIL